MIRVEGTQVLEAIARFDEEPLARALGTRSFLQEVIDLASEIGFTAARLSGLSILAFPSRLTADEKGLRVGRKVISSIRPSSLALMLKMEAEKAGKAPAGFIDALRDAYEVKSPGESWSVPLSEVYNLLTLLPGTRKNYPEIDFVRDLSIIDAYGPYTAKDGKRITFVASTSTRMGKGYRAVSPSGDEVTYGSIRFVDPT